MSTTYRVELFRAGDADDREALLRAALQQELLAVGLHRSVVVEVAADHVAPGPVPVVAVALVGDGEVGQLEAKVSAATEDGVVVIPVVSDLGAFGDTVPAVLTPFNAFEWTSPASAVRLARVLLEELGVEERDRRVFISHRRSDGLGAAEMLHDILSHYRFRPFIDRFAIRHGSDVQATIADALEEFAFLLLLETPDAHSSDWVFDELEYALAHAMGVLIVQWPGDPIPVPGSAGLPRLRLTDAEIVRDQHGFEVPSDSALDRIVVEVEAAHANGLARRRRLLLRSAQESAEDAGARCVPLTRWHLDVVNDAGRSIVAVSPRSPDAYALQRLDEIRSLIDVEAQGVLLHGVRRLSKARRSHLDWLVKDRNLLTIPDTRIGALW